MIFSKDTTLKYSTEFDLHKVTHICDSVPDKKFIAKMVYQNAVLEIFTSGFRPHPANTRTR